MSIVYPTPFQPRQLRLDSTTYCNAHCLSCHKFVSPSTPYHTDYSKLSYIVHKAAELPEHLSEIVPVNYGEYLMFPQWLELLKEISQVLPHTMIVLPTNGTLFDYSVVNQLTAIKTLGVINFSINAYLPETYTKFTGLQYSKLEALPNYIKAIREKRSDIQINCSMVFDPQYQSDFEMELFVNYWKKFASPEILPAASCRRPDKKVLIPRTTPCRSLFNDMIVGRSSRLSFCCFDAAFDLPLGQLNGSIIDAWHNSAIVEFRKLHNSGMRATNSICKECTFA